MSQNDKDSKKQVPREAESGEMKKEGAPVAKGGKKDPKEEELSEEDQQLKEKLELLKERLSDHEEAQRLHALSEIKKEVAGATSSMSSVPKPLKFLSKHYQSMKDVYNALPATNFKTDFADLLSVIGMVASEEGSNESLKYCLEGSRRGLVDWGHEYLRSLAGQIGLVYTQRVEEDTEADLQDLMMLVDIIIPHFMKNHEEPEAVDLLMEVESLERIVGFTNDSNFERVCNYLLSCSYYAADPEEMMNAFRTAFRIFLKHKKYPQALRVAQKMNNKELIQEVMEICTDAVTKKQMGFMLGRQRNPFETADEDLYKIISNERLSEHFKGLARDLDVLEPKHPDQIFKTHLEEKKAMTQAIDSAKQNLATTYVNAFVNAAYGKDLLMTAQGDQKESWIYKNKEGGMQAAAASLGMVLLWDIDEGLSQIDKYMESGDDYIVAGSYIAIGLVNSGIKNETDPVFAILLEKLDSPKQLHKIGALIGLSLAYAGSARADLLEAISPIVLDSSNTLELQAIAALAIGMIYVGTCDEDAAQSILQTLMEKEEKDLQENSFMRIFALALGLLYLGQQDLAEATISATSIIGNQQFRDFLALVVESCAYAGSGNVLKIQKMLHLCAEHKKEEKDSLHQIAAVLGIAMISFGEEIGQEMCLRTMNHLLQYGEPIIKRTVPLAIGLIRVSNPDVQSMDLLTKLSYDTDVNVSMSSIIALGLIGAGTNNSRLAGNLRYLASYYANSPDQLFVVRIAQGLVHMGKGLLGLNPLHSDKFLFSNVSLAGLITVLYTCTDMKTFLVGKYHYFLYYLVLSMYPRMLITLNENLEPIQTSVRVGMAVDTVGAAGKPKTITGFQTHDTPVLLGHGERAELATEEYLAETPIMENFVILRKNPEWEAQQAAEKEKAARKK